MGRIVDKRDGMSLEEKLFLLKAGYSVFHEGGVAIQVFTPTMTRIGVAMRMKKCLGGRFVVREATRPTQPPGTGNGRRER